MQKVWSSIKRLFGFAEKVHTLAWLLEMVGVMAVLTAGFGYLRHKLQQPTTLLTLATFFGAGVVLLILPRAVYSLSGKRGERQLPAKVDQTASVTDGQPIRIHTIDFRYLANPQDSPLNHGWKWSEKDESAGVIFRLSEDAPVPGSLAILPLVFYGLDFPLQQNWILADRVEYSAKYVDAQAAFYTRVTVGFDSGRKDEQIWIAHKVGRAAPEPDGPNSKNWVVFLPGKPIGNGWRSFDVLLENEVRNLYQNQGAFLKHLSALRLRAGLSVSPIQLFEGSERSAMSRPSGLATEK
jgi:hypothetical protein